MVVTHTVYTVWVANARGS